MIVFRSRYQAELIHGPVLSVRVVAINDGVAMSSMQSSSQVLMFTSVKNFLGSLRFSYGVDNRFRMSCQVGERGLAAISEIQASHDLNLCQRYALSGTDSVLVQQAAAEKLHGRKSVPLGGGSLCLCPWLI